MELHELRKETILLHLNEILDKSLFEMQTTNLFRSIDLNENMEMIVVKICPVEWNDVCPSAVRLLEKAKSSYSLFE